jgi:hypothetical protein
MLSDISAADAENLIERFEDLAASVRSGGAEP